VLIALASVLSSGWHGAFRNVLADLRFAWDQRQASGEIVVVAIDASSIEKIGIWPWPRRLHAELLRKLENAGVRDIAFDVDFSAPSDPASDQEFVEALRGAGGSVVLPSFKQPGAVSGNPNALHINRPLKQFSDKELSDIARKIQRLELTPAGTEGFKKAEVTAGGIATSELSSRTMEAKRVPGLYFIGEVVDVTGQLGGYNFQWAWASGYAAGQHA